MSSNILSNGKHTNKPNIKIAYTEKKGERILEAYREAQGNITLTAEICGVPRTTIYALLKQEETLREAMDLVDEEDLQARKKNALTKLDQNVEENSQRAIEYTLEKDPRHRRGKIVVNRSPMDKLRYAGLILGFNEEPEIE